MEIPRNKLLGRSVVVNYRDLCDFNVIAVWTKPIVRLIRLPHWFLGGLRSGRASGESTWAKTWATDL